MSQKHSLQCWGKANRQKPGIEFCLEQASYMGAAYVLDQTSCPPALDPQTHMQLWQWGTANLGANGAHNVARFGLHSKGRKIGSTHCVYTQNTPI